tara:strand:+ start:206 stop:499 length:294 start_codon:yes stop_codon:yes gene_type:complete
MAKTSLVVKIGGRKYPLKINKGEEKGVKKAADDINRAIDILKGSYAVKDMQDLMAMASLQLLLSPQNESASSNLSSESVLEIEEALRVLEEDIDSLQ